MIMQSISDKSPCKTCKKEDGMGSRGAHKT